METRPAVRDKLQARGAGLSREIFDVDEEGSGTPPTQELGKPPLPPPKLKDNDHEDDKFLPQPWEGCYDRVVSVPITGTQDVFNVYISDPAKEGGLFFVCLHGASHSALSFALAAKHLKAAGAGVLAFDLRGHGSTETADPMDLSITTLTQDTVNVIRNVFPDAIPPLILVGHSLGGGITASVAATPQPNNPAHAAVIGALRGLVVVDVVEGTALAALDSSKAILDSRPKRFKSVQAAIKWTVRTGVIRNVQSACVSVPGQLRSCGEPNTGFTWRSELEPTQHHWRGWFEGMSSRFLAAPCPKLLILAGRDRLDKELMLGQMQGKFQVVIFPEASHMVQEDLPAKTATSLVAFAARFGLLVPTRPAV